MRLRSANRHIGPLHISSPACTVFYRRRRTFLTIPNNEPQSLFASRILPYAHEPLYELIADVDSYSKFVPYCSHSRVLQWSTLDSAGRSWPTLADLHVGWGGFNEVFTSRLHCVPGISVEALSGGSIPGRGTAQDASVVFKTLKTRWSLKPLPQPRSSPSTEVQLCIKFQFVNPLYAAVSSAVSGEIAGLMIEAFEKQVHKRLGHTQHP